jgi:uncharacterized membrane protein YvbJ
MVYCSNCGLKNADEAKYCIKCGANLTLKKESQQEEWGEEFGKKMEKWGKDVEKRMEDFGNELERSVEDECIGLPHGGAVIGIIIGIFIIIIGASLALGLDFELWGRWFGTGILILIGLIIMISAIYGLIRKRKR